MGMGNAYMSIADGPFAMFWNPAGPANAPYSEVGTSLGRLQSPRGSLALGALAYMRPYDPIKTATIGAGYSAVRQLNAADKDVFLFHYSQEINIPQIGLSKPLKIGGNFKFLNVEQGGGAGFGAGFDGGLLARSNFGLSGALTITDLTTNVGEPHPTVSFGASYLWHRWLTIAGDMRVRNNLTEFYPGLEASFFQGLLKGRIGRGFQLDGASHVALGMGVNLSPVVIDVAMTVPWSGVNRQVGGYQAQFTYRFGAPPFSGNFVGSAASEAERLKTEILQLEERKSALDAESGAALINRDSAINELRANDERVKSLRDEYDRLLKRKEEAGYELSSYQMGLRNLKGPPPPPRPRPKYVPPPNPVWPRKHKVEPGDTLRSISDTYYGDASLWEQIYNANKDHIERGLPQEGAVFTIPEPKR